MQAVYHFLPSLLFFVAVTSCIGVCLTSLLMWGAMLNNGFRKRITAKELFSKLSPWHRTWHFIFLCSFFGSFLLLVILAFISG